MPTLRLNCLIKGENIVFPVIAVCDDNYEVSDLKEAIQSKRAQDSLKGVGPHILELWKPKDPKSIVAEPRNALVECIENLGHLSEYADKLGASRTVFSIFPTQPPRDYIHIIVKAPHTTTISPSTSNKSNTGFIPDNNNLAGLQKLHSHLWGEDRIIYSEMGCSILDLTFFDALNLNTRPDNILLIRDEYVLAYDHILRDTQILTTERPRSATLVTGQPGIGKTLFLFYVLARRLHQQNPVAFQIDKYKYALFGQEGVTLHSTTDSRGLKGTWALSDSDTSGQRGLCMAFQQPKFHVIHTSSPSSPRWKNWVKRLGAGKYIMDVWSLKEFQTLLALKKLDSLEGEGLFKKYGPSPRIIIHILTKSIENDAYEHEVKTAAATLARKFSAVVLELDDLNFTADISSEIFTVRPKNNMSRGEHALEISTPFLCCTFGLAMSRQASDQQHRFFGILSSHPSFSEAGEKLFENYAHNCLSQPERDPLLAYSRDGAECRIPAPARMIAGTTALRRIKPPHDFYWRPVNPNYEGVDAIICSGNDVWALQYTISKTHKTATNGLMDIRALMNWKTDVTWHLVMVGSNLTDARAARDHQKLGDKWNLNWPTVVYASKLPMGQFNERHEQLLKGMLNDVNDTDSVPDQRADSGNQMDESL